MDDDEQPERVGRFRQWWRRLWNRAERRPYDWSEDIPELRLPPAGHVRHVAGYRRDPWAVFDQ